MAAPECHMRRRTRLAGLQRRRAASTAHVASFATGAPSCCSYNARATGLRCTPLVVLSINSEMECPGLFRLPPKNNLMLRACLPKINVASVAFSRAAQDCLHPDTLCRCVCHGSRRGM